MRCRENRITVYFNEDRKREDERSVYIISGSKQRGWMHRWFKYYIDEDLDYFDYNVSYTVNYKDFKYKAKKLGEVYIIDPDNKLVYFYEADSFTNHIMSDMQVDVNYMLNTKKRISEKKIKDIIEMGDKVPKSFMREIFKHK